MLADTISQVYITLKLHPKTVNEVTYLGITICCKLNWTDHIVHITKANCQLVFYVKTYQQLPNLQKKWHT